jgi:hypothetical protein
MKAQSAVAGGLERTLLTMLVPFAMATSALAQQQADGYAGYNYNVTGGSGGTTSIVTTAAAFISAIGSSSAQFIMFSNALDLGASNVEQQYHHRR